ncbi:prepilin peptidase [bacterium]|nr:prepilin peptidase [bacterium]MDB4545138.1 prepilin peptidase [bacterium]
MLNEPNKLTREAAVRNESCLSTTRVKVEGPYSYSLVGEYSRILLLLVSLPLTIWLLQLVARQSASVIPMVAALVLVASLLSERGLRGVRVFLLVAMTVNVFSSVINPNAFLIKPEAYNPLAVPNVILLICLATASFFETANVCRDNGRPTRIKLMCLGFVLLPALVYVVGVPVVTSWLEAMAEGDSRVNARDPNWTTAKEIALRAAKFGVFLIFVYFGACVGSFLNVVAYCIPRGEAVGFRNSICPVCQNKILRKDNLPVFSYINLSARCRNCESLISSRYLIVELLIASIFGSLFLFELVTGAANVPTMNSVSHTGVLWVVLFPKWNLIGIYFYHCFFISALAVLALMEWDEQKLDYRYSLSLILVFLIAATFYLPFQPLPAPELLLVWIGQIPEVSQFGKLVLGGLGGAALGCIVAAIKKQTNGSTFIPAMALSGVVLGWQSVLHVLLIFLALQLFVRYLPLFRTLLSARPTSVLLLAIWAHHPIWKYLFQQFSL